MTNKNNFAKLISHKKESAMNLSKKEQHEFWREHIIKADAHPEGQRAYLKLHNLADSTYYGWRIKIFGKVKKEDSQKNKKVNPMKSFLPVIVSPSQDTHIQSNTQKHNLPNSQWVAEIITQVIRGLS
jgi:hypothetical protein